MNKLNKAILRYGLGQKGLRTIETSCELHLNLILGYVCIVCIVGFFSIYAIGMVEMARTAEYALEYLFVGARDFPADSLAEVTAKIASLMNGMVLVVGGLWLFVRAIITAFFGLITGIDYLSEKITWRPPSMRLCRKLTDEERLELIKLSMK